MRAPSYTSLDAAALRWRRLLVPAGDPGTKCPGGYTPKVRRIWSSIAGGSRPGCKASPDLRPEDCRPNTVSTRCSSSSSAIAGRRTTSHGSCAST